MNRESKIKDFMLESNAIEGEIRLNPNDLLVVKRAVEIGFTSLKDILLAHRLLTQHLKASWSGRWRQVEVVVGNYCAPPAETIDGLMKNYWKKFPYMDSYKAHNEFEKIHPFQDFNGRMGRLIWLSKAIEEDYDFSMPFLQKFYYQCLSNI